MTRKRLKVFGLGLLIGSVILSNVGFSEDGEGENKRGCTTTTTDGTELGNTKVPYENALMGLATYYPQGWAFAQDFDTTVKFLEPIESENAGEVVLSVEMLADVKTTQQLEQYLRETYPKDSWAVSMFKEKPSFETVRKKKCVRYVLKEEEQVLRIEHSNNAGEGTSKSVAEIVKQIHWKQQF